VGVSEAAASPVVAGLERAWAAIRAAHPEVPAAVLVVASGASGHQLRWGHFAAARWHAAALAGTRPEVLVGREGLARGLVEVLGTLLHEAAHSLADARRIQDVSRGGRYHNCRYAALAAELGLEVAKVHPVGWSATTVPTATARHYAGVLDDLERCLRLWRRREQPASRPPSRNLLACACACPRRIRVAPATLEVAPIVCAACAQPFQPVDAYQPVSERPRLDAAASHLDC
jgi:hypothetical protein